VASEKIVSSRNELPFHLSPFPIESKKINEEMTGYMLQTAIKVEHSQAWNQKKHISLNIFFLFG